MKGKRVIIINAKGGIYSSGPAQALEHQSTYLRGVLGFLGIDRCRERSMSKASGMRPEAAEKAVEGGLKRARKSPVHSPSRPERNSDKRGSSPAAFAPDGVARSTGTSSGASLQGKDYRMNWLLPRTRTERLVV